MSVVLILFLSGAPDADRSVSSTTHPTMEACEAVGRAVQRYRRGRGVLWACVTRAPD